MMRLKKLKPALSPNVTVRKLPRQSIQHPSGIPPLKPLYSLFSNNGRIQVDQHFDICIRILIPTTLNGNVHADTSHFVERANVRFSQRFGGTLCKCQLGFYESESSGLVKEIIFELEAWTNQFGFSLAQTDLEEFIVDILVELGQEKVFFCLNDEAILLKLAPCPSQSR